MPITFNSAGGFLAGTISSSGNDLLITTSGSVGKITLGNTEYTGSEVIEKDASGNVRNKKIFNSDGTITQEKFDASGKTSETKIKDPSSGKEFIRSGSSTDNQIEFEQSANGAFITVSGSSPGYNIIETSGDKDFRLIRAISDVFIKDSVHAFSAGINSNNEYEISANMSFGGIGLKVSNTGDVNVSGGITATSLNVTHFTSSFVTSSTITTEGNTTFGDTDSDSHTFNGNITASGNIKGGGNLELTASNASVEFDGGTKFIGDHSSDGFQIRTQDSDPILFKTNGNNVRATINDGGLSVTGHITASGNISSSATVIADGFSSFGASSLGGTNNFGAAVANSTHHFQGNITASNNISSSGTGIFNKLEIHGADGTLSADYIIHQGDDNTKFGFPGNDTFKIRTAGTDRLHINSSGNVGIGTTSQTKPLTVEGDISGSGTGSFTGGGVFGGRIKIQGASGGDTKIEFTDSSQNIQGTSDYIIIESDNQAVIKADNKVNIDSPVMGVGAFTTGDTAGAVLHISGTTANQKLLFTENEVGTDIFVVSSSGNVGIGTSNPDSALHIVYSNNTGENTIANDFNPVGIQVENTHADGAAVIRLRSSDADGYILYDDNGSNAGDFFFKTDGQDNASVLTLKDGGNVGIGTESPVSKLQVEGVISASGGISSSGKILSNDEIILDDNGGDTLVRAYASGDDGIIDVYQNNSVSTRIAGNGLSYFSDNGGVAIGQITNPAGSAGLTVNGEISASSTITSKTGFVGETQNTGSYDFPGAIMGYNVDGHNSAHNSVSLTTSFAVPDERLHVCFVAPKSGIVEIEAQVRLNMGSSTGAFFYLGLSDSATYNSVAVYYEQVVCDPDENDDVAITHKWVVPSLTPGTTYKYWLGAKVSSTSGTPTIVWGGSQSQRFSDFMMKATALPSNTDIQ